MFQCSKSRRHKATRSSNTTQDTKDDTKDQSFRHIHLFISSFILEYIRKLILYDRIATGDMEPEIGRNFEQYQNFISDFAKPMTSLLGSEISVPINLGLTISTFAARKLKKKQNKKKARKIISILPPDDNLSMLFVALLACDICRMFEHQILSVAQDTSCPYANIRLLAKVAAKRTLNHIATSSLLIDSSVIRIMDEKSNSYNQLENFYGDCVSGVYHGSSKNSFEKLSGKNKDLNIACGDLLTQLGLIFGGVGGTGKGTYPSSQSDYVERWGYRRPSLIFDYNEFKLKTIDDGKLPSDETFTRKGWIVVQFDTSVWKHYKYIGPLSVVDNFECLKKYATSALKKTLTDKDEKFTSEALSDLKVKVQSLPNKEYLHGEIDSVIKMLNQMITKDDMEEIVNKLQDGFFSQIGKVFGKLHKVESDIDKLRADFNELKNAFDLKTETENCNLMVPLRDVPYSSSSAYYIVRQNFIKEINENILKLQDLGDRVLVSGCAGSGKTVGVSQAVRNLVEKGSHHVKYAIQWVNVGDTDEIGLLNILTKIANRFKVKINCIQTLANVCEALANKLANLNTKMKVIFVFDDLWCENYLQYLKFAYNAVIISQETFSYEEVLEILQLYNKKHSLEYFTQREYIWQTIDHCRGLPLAVTLIAGQKLETKTEWESVIPKILRKDVGSLSLKDYRFNLFEMFNFSINRLSSMNKILFLKLGVFKKVKIPISMISYLWQQTDEELRANLQLLQDKSLLTLQQKDSKAGESRTYCSLHGLMVDHLQLPPENYKENSTVSYVERLHENLIENCNTISDGKWHKFEDDGYIYQNIISHAILANKPGTVYAIATSLSWWSSKIRACKTLFSLITDLKECCEYLKFQKQMKLNVSRVEDLFLLVRQYGPYLSMETFDFIQFALCCSQNKTWIANAANEIAIQSTLENPIKFYAILRSSEDVINNYWEQSVQIGSGLHDTNPRVSAFGDIRVVTSSGNNSQNPKVQVIALESSETKFLAIRTVNISAVRISPEGKFIAFCISRYNKADSEIQKNNAWEAWNIDENIQLHFSLPNSIQIKATEDSFDLEFSPKANSMLLTVTANKNQIQIWSIKDRMIELYNVCNLYEYKVTACSFARNGDMIISWGTGGQQKLSETQLLNDHCDIKVWTVTTFLRCRKYCIPYAIMPSVCQAYGTKLFNKNGFVKDIKYVAEELLFINYESFVILLALDESNHRDLESFYKHISKSLKLLFEDFIICISVANDGKFLAALTFRSEIVLFTHMDSGNNYKYSKKIQCPLKTGYIEFVSATNKISAYDVSSGRLQLFKLDPEIPDIHKDEGVKTNSQYTEILDTDSEFVDDDPVIIKLLRSTDQTIQLQVIRGDLMANISKFNLELNTEGNLAPFWIKGRIFSEMNAIVVYCFNKCSNGLCINKHGKPHWHYLLMKKPLDYPQDTNWTTTDIFYENTEFCWSKYRRSDETLVILKLLLESEKYHFTMVDSISGDLLATITDEDKYIKRRTVIYNDLDNIITYFQTMDNHHYIKAYQMHKNAILISKTSATRYNKNAISACRIVIISPEVALTEIHDINDATFDKQHFEYDWKIFEELKFRCYGVYFFIRKRKEFVIINDCLYIWAGGQNNNVRHIGYRMLSLDLIWSKKYLLFVEANSKIYIYDKVACKTVQTLQFPCTSDIVQITCNRSM
ncbi:Apoptotic protease-activating factor 1, partial [Trichoplax sp. H2]